MIPEEKADLLAEEELEKEIAAEEAMAKHLDPEGYYADWFKAMEEYGSPPDRNDVYEAIGVIYMEKLNDDIDESLKPEVIEELKKNPEGW